MEESTLHKKYSIKYLTSILVSLILIIQINPLLYSVTAQTSIESTTQISSSGTILHPNSTIPLIIPGGEPSNTSSLTMVTVGQGTIETSSSGPYEDGTVITLTAIPSLGWEFSGWGGALLASGTTNPTSLVMSQDRWVQATFTESSIDRYTITAVTSGQGSIDLSPNGPYADGTTVTLTAVPASGWVFAGWGGALLSQGTTNPASLNMDQDRWVQAIFTEVPELPNGDLVVLRFESSHTLGSNDDNGYYVSSITDMYFCWPWHSDVIDEMHSSNPESEVIVYYDFMNILSGTSLYQQALNNNWILKNEYGEVIYAQTNPENKVVDRGSQSYRQYVANWVRDQIQEGFDGVYADNAIQLYPPIDWTISELPVNPRTGNLYTDQEWFDDTKGFIDYIKNAVPQAKMVTNGALFNGRSFYRDQPLYQSYLATAKTDSVFIEGMFNNFGTMYSETDWIKSVDLIIWMQNNYLNNPSKSLVIWSQARSGIPDDVSRDQMSTFIYTSSLLGISKTEQNYVSCHGNMASAFTQSLYEIPLGLPEESYHIISGTKIYEREFTKVRVLVNPTTSSYTINLGKQYRNMNGNIVTSITLGKYSGAILTEIS